MKAINGLSFGLGCLFALVTLNSCDEKKSGMHVEVDTFPKTETLQGTPVNIQDSVIRVLGNVEATDNGYIFYQYGAKNLLLATDRDFHPVMEFAPKGEGPGEVNNVSSLYGQKLDNGLLSVFDSSARKMYGANPMNGYRLAEVENFTDTDFNVWRIAKMKNGTYVGARGDYRYGLIAIGPDRNVTEWPVGYEFEDLQSPREEHMSLRDLDYNAERGILGEIYGSLPVVILHDESGKVVKTIAYTGFKEVKNENGMLPDCFVTIRLTSDYVWILKGDEDTDANSEIFVFDYEGNPVASLTIPYAQTITVDEATNRILAIDANQEENNVMLYEIPEFLRNKE
jgi:hypothetical protein